MYIAVMLFSANVAVGTTQDQQVGEQQVESDGGLTVTLNGDTFRRGDTITVSGTVEERDIDSFAVIEVIDPESQSVVRAYPAITADNTFTHSFTAGEAEGIFDKPMTVSGNYRMTVSYTVPGEGFEREEVEFVFEYNAGETTTASSSRISRGGATTPLTIFQSNVDGIRVGVPEGWIVDDTDNTDPINQNRERNNGAGQLAVLCPQIQATPVIGGGYLCPNEADGVAIFRFADLKSRPEFAGVIQANQAVTISDLVAYYIQATEQRLDFTNIRILESIDIAANVTDPQTNQTIATAPAKYAEMTYLDDQGRRNERDFVLLVLSNDGNTGYFLVPTTSLPDLEELSPEQQQIFDTFGLVAANNTTAAD